MRTNSHPLNRDFRIIAAGIYLLIAFVIYGINVIATEKIFADADTPPPTPISIKGHPGCDAASLVPNDASGEQANR